MVIDPASGAYVSAFAIPGGQDGTNLAPGDFLPGQENRTNQRFGMNVFPRQTRHIAYLAGRQDLGGRLTLSGDARWARRDYETRSSPIATLLTVNRNNPFFESPTGANSHLIAYSFAGQTPNPVQSGEVETLSATIGADLDLGGSWRLSSYLAYGAEEAGFGSSGTLQSTYLREALGALADNPATGYSAARDGFLNPFGAGNVNPQAALDFITGGWTHLWSESRITTANVMLDGDLLELPGGPLKLAVGAALRRENFDRKVDSFTSGIAPVLGALNASERDVAAVYAEARIPLFGAGNSRPGLERLELSLAARFEDYGDVGQTTSPKVGLVWEPMPDRNLLITAGTSVPCVLQTAMDSTTPGYVTCVLSRDAWSDNGAVVLMERGTRVLGEYRGGLQQGRRRLFVLWTRAVTPTGVAVALASPAADALGRSGFDGVIDTRVWDRFGGALLLSIVDDGVYAAVGRDDGGATARLPSDAAGVALQGSVDIPPTLRKGQGAEVSIFVAQDLDFSGVYQLRSR